jgi:hypothetical protein
MHQQASYLCEMQIKNFLVEHPLGQEVKDRVFIRFPKVD